MEARLSQREVLFEGLEEEEILKLPKRRWSDGTADPAGRATGFPNGLSSVPRLFRSFKINCGPTSGELAPQIEWRRRGPSGAGRARPFRSALTLMRAGCHNYPLRRQVRGRCLSEQFAGSHLQVAPRDHRQRPGFAADHSPPEIQAFTVADPQHASMLPSHTAIRCS